MSNWSSSISRSQVLMGDPQPVSKISVTSTQSPRISESDKCPYQAVQQVKLLHLEAEVELLLQQLQSLKQQRLSTVSSDAGDNRH